MEGRLTLCNLSILPRNGSTRWLYCSDDVTQLLKEGQALRSKVLIGTRPLLHEELKSDDDHFDKEVNFNAADIEPMITYGTSIWHGHRHYTTHSYSQTTSDKRSTTALWGKQ